MFRRRMSEDFRRASQDEVKGGQHVGRSREYSVEVKKSVPFQEQSPVAPSAYLTALLFRLQKQYFLPSVA